MVTSFRVLWLLQTDTGLKLQQQVLLYGLDGLYCISNAYTKIQCEAGVLCRMGIPLRGLWKVTTKDMRVEPQN